MQRLPSLQTTVVPTHAPKVHVSLLVHALPSLQPLLLFANTQPVAGSHESVVQALPSLQVCVVPDWHALLAQASPIVHTLPSLHAALLAEFTQPEDALQVSLVQALPSSQSIPAPGTQLPAAQASPTVHTLPSLQVLLLFSVWQPVAALHESVVHGLPSSQFWFTPGAHTPPEQTSPIVHTLPSLHAAVLFAYTQPVSALQLSLVQPLLSLHAMTVPDWQLPPAQTSPLVHALLSSHVTVRFVCTQPADTSHESEVHGLLSLQFGVEPPGAQLLAAQMSPMVHALPSEQTLLFGVNAQPPTLLQLSVVHGLLSLHC